MHEALSYTWKNEYVLPYETTFGIREKFCFLNEETYRNFWEIRKTHKNLALSQPYPLSTSLNIYSKINEDYLRYCPKCIQYGYISQFHQIHGIRKCFIHPEETIVEDKRAFIKPRVNDTLERRAIFDGITISTEKIISPKIIRKKIEGLKGLSQIEFLGIIPTSYYFEKAIGYREPDFVYSSFEKTLMNIFRDRMPQSNAYLIGEIKDDDITKANSDAILELSETIDGFISNQSGKEYLEFSTSLNRKSLKEKYFELGEDGLYRPNSTRGWDHGLMPFFFFKYTVDCINKYYKGDLDLYYNTSFETNDGVTFCKENDALLRYANMITLKSVIELNRPGEYFHKFEAWNNALPDPLSLRSNITFSLQDFKFTIRTNQIYINSLILWDYIEYTTNNLARYFKKVQCKIRAEGKPYKVATPTYIVCKVSGVWRIYRCPADYFTYDKANEIIKKTELEKTKEEE